MSLNKIRTGLIFAMQEEQEGLEAFIENKTIYKIGRRRFVEGDLWGHSIVCVLSGIGKVAAASASTLLIDRFKVDQLILTGVAGTCDGQLGVGDIVIAENLLQHDLDVSPLFPRFEIPLSNKSHVATDQGLNKDLYLAATQFLRNDFSNSISKDNQKIFSLDKIKIQQGLIASGDQFISDSKVLKNLKDTLPDLLAVEMEGAAIAQVCDDFGLPFAIVRTISDAANENASVDFKAFIKAVAAPYSVGILKCFFYLQNQKNIEK
jgi:adenosylhomocysteine nucleosidase